MEIPVAKRFEYKIIKLKNKGWFSNRFDYETIIHDNAQQGWRLKAILAPHSNMGLIQQLDLIFEREVE